MDGVPPTRAHAPPDQTRGCETPPSESRDGSPRRRAVPRRRAAKGGNRGHGAANARLMCSKPTVCCCRRAVGASRRPSRTFRARTRARRARAACRAPSIFASGCVACSPGCARRSASCGGRGCLLSLLPHPPPTACLSSSAQLPTGTLRRGRARVVRPTCFGSRAQPRRQLAVRPPHAPLRSKTSGSSWRLRRRR